MPAGRLCRIVGRAWWVSVALTLPLGLSAGARAESPARDDLWSLHAQTTFIVQGYPNIRSPYPGENSLPGKGQARETWTTTLFLGRKLWDGAEVYFNPEMLQGFGLAHTLGVAGFPNGEAQKAGSETPKVRAQRYFFRQIIGLGGEQETVD